MRGLWQLACVVRGASQVPKAVPPWGGVGPSLPGSWDHTSGGSKRRRLLVSDRDHQVSVRVSHGSLGSPRRPQPCVRVRSHPRPRSTAAVEGIRLGRRGLSPRERLLKQGRAASSGGPTCQQCVRLPGLGAHPPGAPPSWEHSCLCITSQVALTKPEVYLPASLSCTCLHH